ncbi:hypothetical protein ACWF2L_21560 [Streptomyces anulatus]
MLTDNTYVYGRYVIVQRISMPKGRMPLLGHGASAPEPYCTGFLGESSGDYHVTMPDAWQALARRMAEGRGSPSPPRARW